MKLNNLKISVRLGLLGGFFLLGLLVVSINAWLARADANARASSALDKVEALALAADTARAAQVEFKIHVQEWKDTLIRGSDPQAFQKYTEAFRTSGAATQDDLGRLEGRLRALGVPATSVADTQAALRDLDQHYEAALKTFDPANPESYKLLDAQVKGMDRPPTAKIDDIVAMIKDHAHNTIAAMRKEKEASERAEQRLAIATLLGVLLIAGFVTVWLARSITRPIHEAVEIAGMVAAGT